MFRSALRELKFHPARYVATILAIAISVGFLAASSIITATESRAMSAQTAVAYSQADLIVSFKTHQNATQPDDVTIDSMTSTIGSVEGVAKAEPVLASTWMAENGSVSAVVHVNAMPSEEFLWTSLSEGSWPASGEIVINKNMAKALGVGVGDSVSLSPLKLTVSGISDAPVGRLIGDPALVDRSWYLDDLGEGWVWGTSWTLALKPGADVDAVKDALTKALTTDWADAQVFTQKEYQKDSATNLTGGIDSTKYVLWVFAGIAMVVGMITIANTFTILLVQRRRQTGLLRAVGASGKQVRHAVWAEALILGLVGGILGVAFACLLAVGVGLYTGSSHFGLVVPLRDTLIAVGLGVLITFIACVAPARRATQVPPIEALQLAAPESARKVGVARAVICGLFVLVGAGLAAYSFSAGSNALFVAIGGAMALSIGILFGGRIFVPWLLKGFGALVRKIGPSSATAAKNVVRDPARASATATALMLAVGLIITLQVGAASMKETTMAKIDQEYPIPLYALARQDETGALDLKRSDINEVAALDGVESVLEVPCRVVDMAMSEGPGSSLRVCSYVPAIATIAPELKPTMADDAVLVEEHGWMVEVDETVELAGVDGPISVTGVASTAVSFSYTFVSPTTYDKLNGTSYPSSLLLVQVSKDADVMTLFTGVQNAFGGEYATAEVGGSLYERYTIETVVDILLTIVTALLAVAVLIALVGVSNTLTLSVIERARENAILRALGFQRRQLKLMLLVEALLLTLAGAVVGLGVGAFFGWLGASAMVTQIRDGGVLMDTHFALDWPQTLVLLAVLVLAAVLASLLPGRRAAKASPVEALAEV